jgi:hypothetical protein
LVGRVIWLNCVSTVLPGPIRMRIWVVSEATPGHPVSLKFRNREFLPLCRRFANPTTNTVLNHSVWELSLHATVGNRSDS